MCVQGPVWCHLWVLCWLAEPQVRRKGLGFIPAPPTPSTMLSIPDLCRLALYPFLL